MRDGGKELVQGSGVHSPVIHGCTQGGEGEAAYKKTFRPGSKKTEEKIKGESKQESEMESGRR